MKFTQLGVNRLKPPATTTTYWDSQLPGFGLRISPKGRKTWIAIYRVQGRAVMETLGTMAVIPDVGVARDMARASMVKARGGIHPVVQKKERKVAEAIEAKAKERTFAWLIEHEENGIPKGFLAQYARHKQRPVTFKQTQYLLARVMPILGPKRLTDITRSDITEVLDAVASKGAVHQARTIQVRLATVFNWAYREDLIQANPMRKIAHDRHGKATVRDRVLADEEIRALMRAADEIGWPFGSIAKLLLLTGQRAGQVNGMRWSELNLDERQWTLPAARTKNKLVHIVPLSDPVIAILQRLPRLEGDLVFSRDGQIPVTGFGWIKPRLDTIMRAKLGRLEPWVWHDLRRTAKTLMSRAGVRPDISERVLGHVMPGLQPVYDRHEYLEEKRAAVERLAALVARIVDPQANVVTLRA
jgi:integrase